MDPITEAIWKALKDVREARGGALLLADEPCPGDAALGLAEHIAGVVRAVAPGPASLPRAIERRLDRLERDLSVVVRRLVATPREGAYEGDVYTHEPSGLEVVYNAGEYVPREDYLEPGGPFARRGYETAGEPRPIMPSPADGPNVSQEAARDAVRRAEKGRKP